MPHPVQATPDGKSYLWSAKLTTVFISYARFCTILGLTRLKWGTAVAQWLGCCATNRKVSGSIPAGVMDINSFRSHCGPGVDSASNRNEYKEYLLGVKAADA